MTAHDIGHLDGAGQGDWQLGLVRAGGLTRLAQDAVDQRARTRRADIRGRTMVELAGELGKTGTGAEVTVKENDGSGWSMTIRSRPVEEGPGA